MRYAAMRPLGSVAMVAALSLLVAGCGGEELAPPTADGGPDALAQWSIGMCEAVASGTEVLHPIDPDAVDPSSEEIFRAYADDFYGVVASGQRVQIAALDELGAPPVDEFEDPYRKALKRLRRSQKDMTNAAATLRKGPQGGQTIHQAMADLGLDFYGGFVADMSAASPQIQQVVRTVDACDQFQSGQPQAQ